MKLLYSKDDQFILIIFILIISIYLTKISPEAILLPFHKNTFFHQSFWHLTKKQTNKQTNFIGLLTFLQNFKWL